MPKTTPKKPLNSFVPPIPLSDKQLERILSPLGLDQSPQEQEKHIEFENKKKGIIQHIKIWLPFWYKQLAERSDKPMPSHIQAELEEIVECAEMLAATLRSDISPYEFSLPDKKKRKKSEFLPPYPGTLTLEARAILAHQEIANFMFSLENFMTHVEYSMQKIRFVGGSSGGAQRSREESIREDIRDRLRKLFREYAFDIYPGHEQACIEDFIKAIFDILPARFSKKIAEE